LTLKVKKVRFSLTIRATAWPRSLSIIKSLSELVVQKSEPIILEDIYHLVKKYRELFGLINLLRDELAHLIRESIGSRS